MTVKTEMTYEQYMACVESLASAYFSEDGNYAPHIGRAVERAVFLDFCVSGIDIDKDSPNLIDDIFSNKEITEAYEKAVFDNNSTGFCFANARADALYIVEYRKSSVMQAVSMLGGVINEIMSPGNLAKVYQISDRLKEIANSKDGNVVELFPKKES